MATSESIFELPRVRDVTQRVLLRYLSRLAVGARLLPIKDLAKELNVGQSNLHAAIRELGQRGVLVSRQRLGTFLMRQISESEMEPERGPTGVTGEPAGEKEGTFTRVVGRSVELVTATEPDLMITRMADAAREALLDRGVRVHVRQMMEPEGVGRIVADVAIYFNPALSEAFMASGGDGRRVVVSTGWPLSAVGSHAWDFVGVDQEAGARLAGEYLRGLGFKGACYAGVKKGDPEYDAISGPRLAGFEAGLGGRVKPVNQLDACGYSLVGGGKAFRRYLERPGRPRAIFAASDDIAVGFVVAAAAVGQESGRDFHMVGFDGLRMGRYMPEGALTTVEVPAGAMGRAAADIAMSRLVNPAGPTQVTRFGCSLFEGVTVGKPE